MCGLLKVTRVRESLGRGPAGQADAALARVEATESSRASLSPVSRETDLGGLE